MSFRFSPSIVTNGLVLCLDAANTKSYPGSGTVWTDLSRSQLNGTLINGPTFNGANGGSIVFDGIDDYVSTSYFGDGTNTSYTFSVWYNPLSNIVGTHPLTRGRDGAGSGSGWSLLLGSDNSSGHRYRAGVVVNSSGYVTYSISAVTQNQWVNIAGVYIYGSSINLYVNGVFNSSVSVPAGPLRTSTDGWVLGSITTTNFSNQRVASALIYNRALSASEILQNYNATKTRFGL